MVEVHNLNLEGQNAVRDVMSSEGSANVTPIDTSRGPMERSMGLSGIHGRPIWKSHFGMYSVEICSKSCEDSHGNIPWGIRLPCDVGRDFHERAHC